MEQLIKSKAEEDVQNERQFWRKNVEGNLISFPYSIQFSITNSSIIY